MYGQGGGVTAVLGATTLTSGAVAGVVLLPDTGNNIIGLALAATAIIIGALAITSQIIVRIVRKTN
jgi:hypothetical protein